MSPFRFSLRSHSLRLSTPVLTAAKISLTMSSFNSALPSLGESELDSDARVALFLDTTTGSDAWRAFKSTVLFTGCVACFSSSFPS